MMPMEVGDGQEETFDMNDDDQLMYTQKVETIEPFSSHIVPVKTGRVYVGECINVMVQALQDSGWLLASRPDCTEHIHRVKERQ